MGKDEKCRTKDFTIGALAAVTCFLLIILSQKEGEISLTSNFEEPVREDDLESTLVIKVGI